MEAAPMIDWDANDARILWNPRMPESERARQERLFRGIPELLRHFWVSTSGSAGRAKWVALSRDAVLAAAEGANRHLSSDARDLWLKAIPEFHVGGLGILARARLSGARVAEFGQPRWDARRFHRLVVDTGATLSALVPAQVFDLVQAGLAPPPSLRAIVVGGGALSEELYFRARALGWNLLPSYGLSECASQVATASLDSLTRFDFPALELLPHVEARAGDGRIELRSAALLTGYALEREGASESTPELGTEFGTEFKDPKRQGWFRTEDLGEVTGRILRPRGREGGFVKMGGESVDFARLEKLFEDARIESGFEGDAALIAAPDQRMEHLTHLVVQGRPIAASALAMLREAFDRRVLPFERIRRVHEVDELPRSSLGKLLKSELLKKLGLLAWAFYAGLLSFPGVARAQAEASAPQGIALEADHELEQSAAELTRFDGKTIASIRLEGLVRTRETSARRLLRQREGEVFDANRWQEGIHNLYNTWVLYDLRTHGALDPADSRKVHLTVSLKDKWTLFPFGFIRSGGGLVSYGGGILDYNLGGNFTNAYAQASVLNGQPSFALNLYQEWLGGTDWMAWLDVSRRIFPRVSIDGVEGRDLKWVRIQQELMLGKRFGERFRVYAYLDFHNDAILSHAGGLEPRVLTGEQYRLRPFFVFGRVNLSSYLQKGEEITIAPVAANFLGGAEAYGSLALSYRRVVSVRDRDNAAFLLSGRAMSPAPLPYQFHLGGFDSVRGFSADRLVGRYSLHGSLEYRPYLFQWKTRLFWVERAVVQGCLFTDAGTLWGSSSASGEGPVDRARSLFSAGMGLRVFLLHYAGAAFRIDFARTISPDESFGLSFGISQFF